MTTTIRKKGAYYFQPRFLNLPYKGLLIFLLRVGSKMFCTVYKKYGKNRDEISEFIRGFVNAA